MQTSKKVFILFISIFVSGFLFLSSPIVHAMTPTLSLVNNGDGDTVQVTVNGDPNVSVIFYYTKTGAGMQIPPLGNTNSSGYFSTSISTSSYQVAPSSSVYVTTGGISGPASNSIVWPIATTSNSNTVTLSQTGVVLSVGQTATITASGSASVYLSNNSNPPIANVNINGNTITIVANANGSTVATVCASNNTSSCSGIYITVQNSGTQALTFGQNNVTIVSGQNVPISISGGTGIYMVQNNPNSAVVQTSINGSVITLSTSSASGSSSITVCSTNMGSCGIINVTVGTASSSTISFNPANPTVSIGQSTNITISGASGGVYYVSSNSNPSVTSATLSSTTLTVLGNTNGSSVISVCSSLGSCGALTVNVNYVASGGTISLSQASLTLLTGQTLSVVVSGGTAPYSVINPSPSIAQSTLSGNILTIYGANLGSELLSVCSAEGGCISLSVLVNGSGAVTQLVLSQSSLSLTVGQGTTITASGNGNYYVSNNSNPSVASAQVSGSSIFISPIAIGTDSISICQNGGQCVVLYITVSAASSQATATSGLPQGCVSTSGYSPVTGQSCATGTSAPAVIAPEITQPASYIFPRYLGYGDKGEDVLMLQTTLARLGYLSATPNGNFGPATKSAVQKFQQAHGIRQTGNVGPSTKDALNQLPASPTTPTTITTREQQIATIQQALQALLAQAAQAQSH